MELSSPSFRALAVSAGLTFWFFIITSSFGVFSLEILFFFIIVVFPVMQLLSLKLSKVLDSLAVFNTKLFLGILFVCVVSLYGIFFRILRVDILRLRKQNKSYWLDMEQLKDSRILYQY